MNRTDVVQRIIDKKNATTYLEIGVCYGDNFFPIKVQKKVAVDPHFQFSRKLTPKWILKWTLRNWRNLVAEYHELTSDAYFAALSASQKFDVIFIDGLHTYEQSLKDVVNSLNHLAESGVIVMHDCNPLTEAAAHPAKSCDHFKSLAIPGATWEWNGDVWKTICRLRSTRDDLRVFVLDCDHGLGIVTRGKPQTTLQLSESVLDSMAYAEFAANRQRFLDLKGEDYLSTFLESLPRNK